MTWEDECLEGMDNIMVHYLAGSKHVNQDTKLCGLTLLHYAVPCSWVVFLKEGLPAPPYGEAVNLGCFHDWGGRERACKKAIENSSIICCLTKARSEILIHDIMHLFGEVCSRLQKSLTPLVLV